MEMVKKRRKTGFAAIDTDMGFVNFDNESRFISKKERIGIVEKWLKNNGYDNARIKNIMKSEDRKLTDIRTFYRPHNMASYCYWHEHVDSSNIEKLHEKFDILEKYGQDIRQNPIKSKPVAKSNTDEKLDRIIGEMDYWQDQDYSIPMDVFKWLESNRISQSHAIKIRENYIPEYEEISLLSKKDCPVDLKEGYASYKRKDIKKMLSWYDAIFDGIEAYENVKKASRKPRKRHVSKDKIVANLKFKQMDDKYRIASIDPIKILDSTQLWVFNTKTRKLGKYVAEPNMTLSIKGTTLQNFSESKSIQKTIRKPEEVLKKFSNAGKVALRKFMDNINTVEIRLNGRINSDIILLKVIK